MATVFCQGEGKAFDQRLFRWIGGAHVHLGTSPLHDTLGNVIGQVETIETAEGAFRGLPESERSLSGTPDDGPDR